MTRKLIVLILSFVVMGLGAFVAFNPAFSFKELTIKGHNVVSKKAVMVIANQFIRQNILKLRVTHALDRKLLHAIPQLQAVTVKVQYPNALVITLVEKLPKFAIIQESGSIFLSKDGIVLQTEADDFEIKNLSNLIVMKGVPTEAISTTTLSPLWLSHITLLVEKIERQLTGYQLQVEFRRYGKETDIYDEIVLLKDDTMPIYIGEITNLEEKMRLLHHFFTLNLHKSKNIKYIDCRLPPKLLVSYSDDK